MIQIMQLGFSNETTNDDVKFSQSTTKWFVDSSLVTQELGLPYMSFQNMKDLTCDDLFAPSMSNSPKTQILIIVWKGGDQGL